MHRCFEEGPGGKDVGRGSDGLALPLGMPEKLDIYFVHPAASSASSQALGLWPGTSEATCVIVSRPKVA